MTALNVRRLVLMTVAAGCLNAAAAGDTPARTPQQRVEDARNVLKLRQMFVAETFRPTAATPSPQRTLEAFERELEDAASLEPLLPLLHPAVGRDYWLWRLDARYHALAASERDWVARYRSLFERVRRWGETRYETSPPRAIVSVRLDDRDPRPDGQPLPATRGQRYEFLLEGSGPLWRLVTVRAAEDAGEGVNRRFAANPLGRPGDDLEPPAAEEDHRLPEDRILTQRLREIRKAAQKDAHATGRPRVSPEQTVAALCEISEDEPTVDDVLPMLSSRSRLEYVADQITPSRRRPLKTDDDRVRFTGDAFAGVVGFVGTRTTAGEARVRYVVQRGERAFVEYEATLVPEAGVWRLDHVEAVLWRNHATPGLRTLARR